MIDTWQVIGALAATAFTVGDDFAITPYGIRMCITG